MARVLVAVPTFDGGIKPKTFESLANMDWADCDVEYAATGGYDCAMARNEIAQTAVDRGFDWLMMVDSDMVVPQDALSLMLEWDEPVVYAYCARQGRFDGETCICRPESFNRHYFADELKAMRDAGECKVPTRGGGMGCVLIRVDTFRRINKPWFKYRQNADGTALSEDYFFALQCRNAGIELYADARVACGHYFRHVEYL